MQDRDIYRARYDLEVAVGRYMAMLDQYATGSLGSSQRVWV